MGRGAAEAAVSEVIVRAGIARVPWLVARVMARLALLVRSLGML